MNDPSDEFLKIKFDFQEFKVFWIDYSYNSLDLHILIFTFNSNSLSNNLHKFKAFKITITPQKLPIQFLHFYLLLKGNNYIIAIYIQSLYTRKGVCRKYRFNKIMFIAYFFPVPSHLVEFKICIFIELYEIKKFSFFLSLSSTFPFRNAPKLPCYDFDLVIF